METLQPLNSKSRALKRALLSARPIPYKPAIKAACTELVLPLKRPQISTPVTPAINYNNLYIIVGAALIITVTVILIFKNGTQEKPNTTEDK